MPRSADTGQSAPIDAVEVEARRLLARGVLPAVRMVWLEPRRHPPSSGAAGLVEGVVQRVMAEDGPEAGPRGIERGGVAGPPQALIPSAADSGPTCPSNLVNCLDNPKTCVWRPVSAESGG